jgi:2,3-bisphosphoglycerate-independent phosphoglycerate mutase
VDLINGIGICAGLIPIKVEGVTGNLHTNYKGKYEAGAEQLKKMDLAYIHIEAPDECGHQGDIQCKLKAIELIDQQVIGPLYEGLSGLQIPFRMMVLPDHPTPIALRTHSGEPVPFLIYDSSDPRQDSQAAYDEFWPAKHGIKVEEGHKLMDIFIGRQYG